MITAGEIQLAMETSVQQILNNLTEFTYRFQKADSENNFLLNRLTIMTGPPAFGPGKYGWPMNGPEMSGSAKPPPSRWTAFTNESVINMR